MSHTTGEKLIKPLLIGIIKVLKDCDIDVKKIDADEFVNSIPLSNSTISQRIKMIAEDLKAQTMDAVRSSPTGHSITSDESVDVNNKAQLVTFAR